MKFLGPFALAVAGTALAHGGEAGGTPAHGASHGSGAAPPPSTEMQCRQLEKLGRLVDLANNQTLLDEDTEGDKAEMEAIKAEAAEADSKLKGLQKNATLVHACSAIEAEEVMKERCEHMHRLEELAALVANQTALDARTHSNASKAQALKDRVHDEAGDLKALAGNSTLVRFCAANTLTQTCTRLAQWQKQVDQAANATAVAAKYDDDDDLITEFQIKVKMAQSKLADALKNLTLVEACKQQGMALEPGKNGLGDPKGGAEGKGGEGSNSGAIVTQPAGAMLSLVVVFFASAVLL